MVNLASSKQCVAERVLATLAGFLRQQVEVAAEIGPEIDGGKRPDPAFEWGPQSPGPSAMDPDLRDANSLNDLESCLKIDAMKLPVFREPVEFLRENGLASEASEILKRFDSRFQNAGRTLEYAEALLRDLKPASMADDGGPAGDDTPKDAPAGSLSKTTRKRTKPGRPKLSKEEREQDKHMYEAWKAGEGEYASKQECAEEFDISLKEFNRRYDRERKRRERAQAKAK